MKYMRVLLAALAALAFMSAPLWANTPGEVDVGQVLHNLSLRGLNGPARALASYQGKPLLINVWASWCGPCRQEMGSLERLAWGQQAGRFAIIGISTDDSEPAAKAYLRQANATISHYIDSALQAENMLGADRLPLTILVDAKGRVLGKYYGAREWDNAESVRWIESRLRVTPP
jgi:thiol-disulfide isomerase/thioredoxin